MYSSYAPQGAPAQQPPAGAYGYQSSGAMYGGEAQYGSIMGPQKVNTPRHHKGRVNISAVLLCLLAPCALFSLVCAALSFQLHKDSPGLMWLTVICCLVVTAACTYLAGLIAVKRWNGDMSREPFWYIVLAASLIIAFGTSFYLGEINWWNNLLPYNELQTLSSHDAVDPSTMPGQQLMDVGRVQFLPGTKLDFSRTIGFKNSNLFCVAPIVLGNSTPATGSYDYWAIGLNCCSGAANDFHCGEYDNPQAHAGLRIMREDQRAFYRLAVQQAEAAYNIRSVHPMFFYWMQDPHQEMESYRDDTMRSYILGILAFFAFQLFAMIVAVVVFTKL
mmetsp:Transcript_36299/g.93588  ORF Transcript_36299/g.93588 Transcript_36299/m.93588 type:complete len:332 (+) Transcript_36299:67-1062(+)